MLNFKIDIRQPICNFLLMVSGPDTYRLRNIFAYKGWKLSLLSTVFWL